MLDNNLLQEAGAVLERSDAEVGGEGLPQVGKRPPGPEIHAGTDTRAGDENRDVLARVIGAGRRRIVAVIGGDDQQVRFPQHRQHVTKALVEALEVVGVPPDVVAVPVQRIEVYEIDEDEPRCIGADDIDQPIDTFIVALRRNRFSYASAGEQIPDLADRDDGNPLPGQEVEQRIAPAVPTNGRAMTRPTRIGATSSNAISHIR